VDDVKGLMKTSTPHLLCDRHCFTIRCAVVTQSVLAIGHETWRREKVDQRRNHVGKIGLVAGVLRLAMGPPAIVETTSVFMPGPCRPASQQPLLQLLLSERSPRNGVTTPNGNKNSAAIELGPSIGQICRTATHHRDRATGNGLDNA